tara:strand:+ start:40 stop:477 length:438 start_codon:yes stop_codon:yes gene_type:complete
MAILDKSRKPYIQDNDEEQFIGLSLPFTKSDGIDGWFQSTRTTLDAVKQNIKLLLSTERGERLMQPTIGLGLRTYLFQQLDNSTVDEIKADLTTTFQNLLPFVTINNIDVNISQMDSLGKNTISIKVDFHVTRDPNTLDSVIVDV